jgi:hypothetical protein
MTFARLKQRFSASRFDRLRSTQSKEIIRILGASFSASAPHYHIEVFISLGLIPVERGGAFHLEVQPHNARKICEWPGEEERCHRCHYSQTP